MATYTFTAAGVYNIKLTVTDQCGNSATATQIGGVDMLVVIYDPSAGFVTGGGWINSPQGAYMPGMSLYGKANFGFVSKYKKGAAVPTGETEFQFQTGNVNFHSSTYNWLVISGPKAQYKGNGTINKAGSYNFMLTAWDGQISGGGGVDKFRMKIWDTNTSQVIYDNQSGALDDAYPTTALGGGSIVIQKSSGTATPGTGHVMTEDAHAVPTEYELYQNYPNPFNPSTEIKFDLPERSIVSLKVYNIYGQLVETLVDGIKYEAGRCSVHFDASGMASGVYIYHLTTSTAFSSTKKMLLVR